MKIITNLYTSPHKLTLDAFNENKEKISNITESNYDEILPPGSIVTGIFSISRITIGSYGVILKHIVRQILIKKSTILPTDVSLLADEDDSDEIPRRPKKNSKYPVIMIKYLKDQTHLHVLCVMHIMIIQTVVLILILALDLEPACFSVYFINPETELM